MIKTKAKIRMNIASPVRNIDNVKKNINKIDTNDKHVIHRNEKIKGYYLRMCLASPLRFQPLEKKYVPRPQT